MNDTVVVFGLNTSLDRSAFGCTHKLAEDNPISCNEILGDDFPKPIFHEVAAIRVLRAKFAAGCWVVQALGAPHRGTRSERDLIASFVCSLEESRPRLVTFNGGSFDLPVLRWRAMLHEVSAPALSARNYFSRYLDDAVDLCDPLASFNNRGKVLLDHARQAFGLGGKPKDMDGGRVQENMSGSHRRP